MHESTLYFRLNNKELEKRFLELEEWKANQRNEKLKLKQNFEVSFLMEFGGVESFFEHIRNCCIHNFSLKS